MKIQPIAAQATSMSSITRANLYFLCLLFAIFVFQCATLRTGHMWGDDFAMYIHHAKNIVEHQPYAETGYIYNPRVPAYGPRTYPPVFPLMLAPLYGRFGANVMPMKLEQITFFVLTLLIVFALWRRDLGTEYSLALVAILGLSPVFVSFKENVLSDLPFLFFFYLAALIVDSIPAHGKWWPWSLSIGVTLYLAMGTRSAGIALPLGLVLYDLARCRKIRFVTGVALAVCGALALLQRWITGFVAGSYLEQGGFVSWHSLSRNAWEYSRALAGFWVGSVHGLFSFLVLLPVLTLTLMGLNFRRNRQLTIVEAFLLPYAAVILLWPFSGGSRLAFPFLPWMVFLASAGFRRLSATWLPQHTLFAICTFLLALAIPNVEAYRRMDFSPIQENTGLPEFSQLCNALRNQTRPEDIFIYYRPRALALYTDRSAATYNYLGTDQELWQWLQQIHASYLITTTAFDTDGGFLRRFASKYSANLDVKYRNSKFSLYRIQSIPE
ncbi:MAG TPA: glycosyltransferase family 39 protein [Candidatus Sulfotelmatobacter sp.]|jgi:4-amino-4-deoxy-L-arabinose transferase-like glycosyltransferase